MRPLKFRFWNKIARTYKRSWRNALCHDGTFIEWEPEATSYSDPIEFSMSIIVAQQYTGLNDANGKEIYEGDILKHDIGLGPVYWEVIWNAREGAWKTTKENGGNTGSWFDCYEVAGNIFENPELLRA